MKQAPELLGINTGITHWAIQKELESVVSEEVRISCVSHEQIMLHDITISYFILSPSPSGYH